MQFSNPWLNDMILSNCSMHLRYCSCFSFSDKLNFSIFVIWSFVSFSNLFMNLSILPSISLLLLDIELIRFVLFSLRLLLTLSIFSEQNFSVTCFISNSSGSSFGLELSRNDCIFLCIFGRSSKYSTFIFNYFYMIYKNYFFN